MNRSFVVASLLIAVLLASCAPPFGVGTVMPVETAVALTLEAIAAAATPLPTQTAAPVPTPPPDAIPRPLYFRNLDAGGVWQIYRIGRDGRTLQQLTFEPLSVDAYDISARDGSLGYVTNNQLFVADAAGGGRRMLIDGGPIDPNNPWGNTISSPLWSPDGTALAYGQGGLSFIDPNTGSINKVLQNQIDFSPGFALVKEIYAPRAYSPDGSKLLIEIGYYEAGTYGIFVPASNSLLRMLRADGAILCCQTYWIPDGSGLYISSSVLGMVESGLYFADAATGSVNILIPGAAPDATYNFASGTQVGPDNKLYFFFNNLPEIPTEAHTPLYLVRSDPDGVTGRVQLLPDQFQNINEILWDPGASLAVLVIANAPTDNYGGSTQVIYLDGRLPLILSPFARDISWEP